MTLPTQHVINKAKHAAIAAFAVTYALLASSLPSAGASTARFADFDSQIEQRFVTKINQTRASLGLTPLTVDAELQAQARVWSETMAARGDIFHTTNLKGGISANWKKLGENVGVGSEFDSLYQAFIDSPKHYENIVDPAYTTIGVGVVWSNGRMFTAHRFMGVFDTPAATPTPTTQPTTTTTPPPTPGPAATPTTTTVPNTPAPTTTVPTPKVPTPVESSTDIAPPNSARIEAIHDALAFTDRFAVA